MDKLNPFAMDLL